MSRVINMVGGGGGSVDSFMELIGATQMVEMTYTPTSDTTNFYLPNTSGTRYKGIIVEAGTHETIAGTTRYVDYFLACLDGETDSVHSYPTGRYTYNNTYEYIQSYSGLYLTNIINRGVYIYFNYSLVFKTGKTYNVKLFY